MSGSPSRDSGSDADSSYQDWGVEQFEAFCASDELSIRRLRRVTSCIFDKNSLSDFEDSPFFFLVCMNKNVTAEIVEHLLEKFQRLSGLPGTATLPDVCMDMDLVDEDLGLGLAFPIHLACLNENCPSDAIALLLERGGDLSHLCQKDEEDHFRYGESVGGTPLHFYLKRKTNVEPDVVKKLFDYSPDFALSLSDNNTKCTPMHTLMMNPNLGAMYAIVELLVETCPSILRLTDTYKQLPCHLACANANGTYKIISLLLKVWPESVHQKDELNHLPLHQLCERETKESDEEDSLKILRLLLNAYPESVHVKEDCGDQLPIHIAAGAKQGPEFCKILIEDYPESHKVADGCGYLPLHLACSGRPETVTHLLNLHPEGIHVRSNQCGFLPIHDAAFCADEHTIGIFRVLLEADPDCLTKAVSVPRVVIPGVYEIEEGSLPLHVACANCSFAGVAEFLFDLYPDAILARNGTGKRPIDVLRQANANLPLFPDGTPRNAGLRQRNIELLSFLDNQTNCAIYARNRNMMMTEDSSGRLPLYQALSNQARLGAIKLIYHGYPEAFGKADHQEGRYPLEIAITKGSVEIVKFLAENNKDCLDVPDPKTGAYPLHIACEGNCDVIKYLLKRSAQTVAVQNSDGKLPIQLFCEFVHETISDKDEQYDPESTSITDIIWSLLVAHPETLNNW